MGDDGANETTNSTTALAVVEGPKKRAKASFCKHPFLLFFGKAAYYVPDAAVVSYPKGTNKVTDAEILNGILKTKTPSAWEECLDPDRLVMIRGVEGTCVYTTFKVMNNEDHEEEVFLRNVPFSCCEKSFPVWKERVATEIEQGVRKPAESQRQQARLKVLEWTRADCNRPQLDPIHNGWEICKDPPKSLKVTSLTGTKRTVREDKRTPTADDHGVVFSTSTKDGVKYIDWTIPLEDFNYEPTIKGRHLHVATRKFVTPVEEAAASVHNKECED